MTETERITDEVWMRNGLKFCATEGCSSMVAGCDYCAQCREVELTEQEAYPFADLLLLPTLKKVAWVGAAILAGIVGLGMILVHVIYR